MLSHCDCKKEFTVLIPHWIWIESLVKLQNTETTEFQIF